MKNGGNLRQFGPLWGKGKLFVSQDVSLFSMPSGISSRETVPKFWSVSHSFSAF
jgi:hypothetical protein